MKRIEAIKKIVENVTDEVIISSAGMVSRELYLVKDRPRNFYMQGSMGNALAIGLGIAINSKHKVIVITGDGEVLMSLSTLILHKKLSPVNLHHYILDNNCYASTGGQPTCSDVVDFSQLAPNTMVFIIDKEKGYAPLIFLSPRRIAERFRNALGSHSS